MKKVMWIVSVIPFIITAIALQFMPDSVPMHYNISGEIDRWGSKYENLIFPVMILLFTLFWHLLILYYEKRAVKATLDKNRAEAASNAGLLKIVAVSMAAMFGIMQCFILYGAHTAADTATASATVDIGKISCILMGGMFIVIGNFLPKAKRNSLVGVRVSWSMYNDTTWRKSNRFGAVAFIVTGVLTILTALLADTSWIATACMLGYLLLSTVITLFYSHRIYLAEKH